MAKKEETPKTVLERNYNVPLRREFLKVASWRRTEKAVTALRKFVVKHMKSDNVILGKYVNMELWKHGIKNPPHHVKISAKKDDKGKVVVELEKLPAKAKRELEKQEKSKKETKKAEEKKAEEAKKEEKAPEKQEQAKKEEKEELKEIKKELPKQTPQPLAAPKQVEQRPTAPKSQ